VRQLTDSTGAVTFARTYDPYGVTTTATGNSASAYGFTGEWTDPGGLVYLRARHYAPGMGRFLTRDTWVGDYNMPMSYNKWLYAYSQPIDYIDPSGLSPTTLTFAVYEDDYHPEKNRRAPRWSGQAMFAVEGALGRIAIAYANAYNQRFENNECEPAIPFTKGSIDPITAFFKIHGGRIKLNLVNYLSEHDAWGLALTSQAIRIYKDAPLDRMSREFDQGYAWDLHSGGRLGRFITHEMGHVFENAYERDFREKPGRYLIDTKYKHLKNSDGFATDHRGISDMQWQWRAEGDNTGGEIFADMFVGWVHNNWMKEPASKWLMPQYLTGLERASFMNENMPIWITRIIEK
jgi:RHS repeat-associated protein